MPKPAFFQEAQASTLKPPHLLFRSTTADSTYAGSDYVKSTNIKVLDYLASNDQLDSFLSRGGLLTVENFYASDLKKLVEETIKIYRGMASADPMLPIRVGDSERMVKKILDNMIEGARGDKNELVKIDRICNDFLNKKIPEAGRSGILKKLCDILDFCHQEVQAAISSVNKHLDL